MANVKCIKCDTEREGLSNPPMASDIGRAVQAKICTHCWQEWLAVSTKLINEYKLQLFRPEHRGRLEAQMTQFFNLPD
jgi:Fe-S cluster biosynthesis and repair protein YggX